MRTTGNSTRALGRRRLGRRGAEALLDGAGGIGAGGESPLPAGSGFEAVPDFEAVGRLLDAAAGPALAAELSGEDAARAVFSAHHSAFATPSKERRVFSKALLTKAVTVKIAVAVCGVSVVGAATAAATNTLPASLQSKAHSTLGFPAPKSTTTQDGDQNDNSQKESDDQGQGHPSASGSKAAKPSSSKDDQNGQGEDQDALDAAGAKELGDDGFRLCKAAEDGDRDDQGNDLTADDLQKLAKAAHVPAADIAKLKSRADAEKNEAQKKMQDFCTRLAQAEKEVREGHTPKFPVPQPHDGDGWPTTWPSQLPSVPGLPSHLPTGLPSHLPTGLPSHLPTSVPTGWPTGWPVEGGPQNPVDPIHQQGEPSATVSATGSVGVNVQH